MFELSIKDIEGARQGELPDNIPILTAVILDESLRWGVRSVQLMITPAFHFVGEERKIKTDAPYRL